MGLKTSLSGTAGQIRRLTSEFIQSQAGLTRVQQSMNGTSRAVTSMKSSLDTTGASFGRLRSTAQNGTSGVQQLKSAMGQTEATLTRVRGGADRLRAAIDRVKNSFKGARGEVQAFKRTTDGAESSVGRTAKTADKGDKSMGNLGKGLKGASLAQKGLNLAMAASPFGLVLTLLTPLIAQFVTMDKVTALLRKGVDIAMKHIGAVVGSMAKATGPVLRGLGNGALAPFIGLAVALNALFGVLAGIRISIPDWVPRYGGRGFSFPRFSVPVPRLATGGVVRARSGGTLALLGEGGEHEAVLPLSKLERMLGQGGGLRTLTAAVEKLADRPVVVQVDSQEIARAVFLGQRQLARR
ncbi:hypothetical protein AB0O01_13020 [Streptomyces sp. NPDC093252]|uniref:hypothetical protein n=1 Tax=Streptomyces sp. NPDC093252 TaxID=3154980 RepID=UPI0034337472